MSLPVVQTTPGPACCTKPGSVRGAPPVARSSVNTTLALALALAAWIAAYSAIHPLSQWITFRVFGLAPGSHLGESVA